MKLWIWAIGLLHWKGKTKQTPCQGRFAWSKKPRNPQLYYLFLPLDAHLKILALESSLVAKMLSELILGQGSWWPLWIVLECTLVPVGPCNTQSFVTRSLLKQRMFVIFLHWIFCTRSKIQWCGSHVLCFWFILDFFMYSTFASITPWYLEEWFDLYWYLQTCVYDLVCLLIVHSCYLFTMFVFAKTLWSCQTKFTMSCKAHSS